MENIIVGDSIAKEGIKRGWSINDYDSIWMLNLFGTAIGAGVLFLPITVGQIGFSVLIPLILILAPATYFAHYFLTEFILSTGLKSPQITTAVSVHHGEGAGGVFNWIFFLSIFPILLVYGVGLTNTIDSIIVHQLEFQAISRPLLSLGLTVALAGMILCGFEWMLRLCTWATYPLILSLFGISVYLIPGWHFDNFVSAFKVVPRISDLWLFLPVFIFAFNHSPIISKFACAMRETYGESASQKSRMILMLANMIMQFFVIFFVVSCVLTLTPAEISLAKAENISVLSFFANKFHQPMFTFVGSFVALVAILSSFFGHYMGAFEGLKSICLRAGFGQQNVQRLNGFVHVVMFASVWMVSTWNPNILTMISTLCGPFIAFILFILPSMTLLKLGKLSVQGIWLKFVLIIGIVTVFATAGYLI